MSPYATLYIAAEAACLAAAWIFLRRADRAWKMHRYYLVVVLALELAGITYKQYGRQGVIPNGWPTYNHWILNIQLLVTAVFLGWFMHHCLNKLQPLSRCWLYGWYTLFGAWYAADAWLNGGLSWWLNRSFVVLQAGVIVAGFYYLWLTLRPQATYKGGLPAAFLWVFATCAFYFGMAVYQAFFNQLTALHLPVWGVEVSRLMMDGLNLALYGTWSYAFYVCRNRS